MLDATAGIAGAGLARMSAVERGWRAWRLKLISYI